MIAIRLVAAPDMPFAVHRGLLRQQSPWFADQLEKDQAELLLQNVPQRTFRLFTAWLYAGKLVHPDVALYDERTDADIKPDDTYDAEPTWTDTDLVWLFTFAQYYRIRKLRNDVLTAIHRDHARTGRLTTEAALRLHWTTCGSANALARFMLQERALYGLADRDDVPAYFKTLPASFLANVLRAAASLNAHRARGYVIHDLPSACHWHDHADDSAEKSACRARLARAHAVTTHADLLLHHNLENTALGIPRGERRSQPANPAPLAVKPSSTAHARGGSSAGTTRSRDAWARDSSSNGWKADVDMQSFHPLYIAPVYPSRSEVDFVNPPEPPPYEEEEEPKGIREMKGKGEKGMRDVKEPKAIKEVKGMSEKGKREKDSRDVKVKSKAERGKGEKLTKEQRDRKDRKFPRDQKPIIQDLLPSVVFPLGEKKQSRRESRYYGGGVYAHT